MQLRVLPAMAGRVSVSISQIIFMKMLIGCFSVITVTNFVVEGQQTFLVRR